MEAACFPKPVFDTATPTRKREVLVRAEEFLNHEPDANDPADCAGGAVRLALRCRWNSV